MADSQLDLFGFECKRCTQCQIIKNFSDFGFIKGKPISRCKRCIADNRQEWRKNNPEQNKKELQNWRKNNREKDRAHARKSYKNNRQRALDYQKEYFKNNTQKVNERVKLWVLANPEKMKAAIKARFDKDPQKFIDRAAHYAAKYRAAKLQATPPWADLEKIKSIYIESSQKTRITGQQYSVDHVVPLRGKTVCGLHVHYNLRIILLVENQQKFNNLVEDLIYGDEGS